MSSDKTNLVKPAQSNTTVFFTNCDLLSKENVGKRTFSSLVGFFFMLFQLFFSNQAIANPPEKLGFSVTFSQPTYKIGDTIELIFTAKIKHGFHVYSEKSDCPADDGPIRSEIAFTENSAVTIIGKAYGVGDKMVKEDEIWHCSTGEFDGMCEFRQKIVVGSSTTLQAHYYGQQCSITDGICYMIEEEISIPISVQNP
ncbi:MAG: hypothetical protein IT244_04790 [Bacteroidia bacterium]|nr:hypothetical protein [Bacteroidia bacterium]